MRVQNTEVRRQNTEGRCRGERLFAHPNFFPIMMGLPKHLLILCTVLIISACGGGGSGESSSTSPSSTIVFSGSTPGSNSVYLAQNNIIGDDLTIDIKVNNLSSGIYGAAFNVDFDSSKIMYESYTNGSFLEQGDNSATYQVALQSNNSGRLVLGISRQGNVSGVMGSGTLITLKFRVAGSSSLSFSDNELRDSSNQVISTTWYGGEVTVQ